MNLPQYVRDILAKKFKEEEVKVIDANWDSYIQIRLGDATAAKLVRCGKDVLALVAEEGK